MSTVTERIFFEHIAVKIGILARAYTYVLEEIEIAKELPVSAAASGEFDYALLLKRLNRSIDDFKREMKRSLDDYYTIMPHIEGVLIGQNAEGYFKTKIDELHREVDRLRGKIPENILKKQLGHNYYFHSKIKKLTPSLLLEYFDTNYCLVMEEDLKKKKR